MTDRRTPEDWIAAAFRALAQGGLGAVRAEALARDLGVTKGSFYWHFKDMPALLQVMLTHWEDQATDRIVALAEGQGGTPADRLRRLADLATSDLDAPYGGFHTEAAIRDWARRDPTAAGVQARVDARRQRYLAQVFDQAGLDQPAIRARLVLAGLVGLQHMAPEAREVQRVHLRFLIAALLTDQPISADPAQPTTT